MRNRLMLAFFVFLLPMFKASASASANTDSVQVVQLPNGINLHYISKGAGPAMVFVPGSISDYTYWDNEVVYFSKYYHVIAYSRRYDYPNHNLTRPGYSAKSDAEDLAELIKVLKLSDVVVVGHSSGALVALYLAINHPEMVSKLVLSEPFAIALLDNLSGPDAVKGRKLKQDMAQRMATPMRKAFKAGNNELGIQTYVNYVNNSRFAWKRLPVTEQHEALRNSYEWEVMMTAGVLFPSIDIKELAKLKAPVLLLSGGRSYRFDMLTDGLLQHTIPNNSRVIFAGANDRLWYQRSAECERIALEFLTGKMAARSRIRAR